MQFIHKHFPNPRQKGLGSGSMDVWAHTTIFKRCVHGDWLQTHRHTVSSHPNSNLVNSHMSMFQMNFFMQSFKTHETPLKRLWAKCRQRQMPAYRPKSVSPLHHRIQRYTVCLTRSCTSFFAHVLAEVACVVLFLTGNFNRNEGLTKVLLCDQLGTCMRLHLHLCVQPQRSLGILSCVTYKKLFWLTWTPNDLLAARIGDLGCINQNVRSLGESGFGLFCKGSCRCKFSFSCILQGLQIELQRDWIFFYLDEIQFSPNWPKAERLADGALACGAEKSQLWSGFGFMCMRLYTYTAMHIPPAMQARCCQTCFRMGSW